MEPVSRTIEGADGVRLHLLEWSREGVAMLLIHGFGNDAHIWDAFAPAVSPSYRVIALDLRGHGDSEWDAQRRYEYDDHVRDLECVVEALECQRLVLVSHSLGGRISMLYAARHPDIMAGLVIVDSAPELDPRGITRISLEVGSSRDPSFASVDEFERTLPHAYPAAPPEALRRMARHGVRQRKDGRFVLKMDPALRGFGDTHASSRAAREQEERSTAGLWDALGGITCPTLVVRGAASDFLAPDVADKMVDEVLANASLTVVPQSGHSVMIDNPMGFEAAVCRFVLAD
jgi:pimeloyl-ACP methyl ester carboxylesterase